MKPAGDAKRPSDVPFVHPDFWVAAIGGALLSLVVTGYAFPAGNNVFHLPIVARLWDLPEFADDAFVQSLRHFSSGLWMVLAGSADRVEPRVLFLVLLVFSRLLSFLGFLACADHFGIREAKRRFLFAGLIAVTPLMQSLSFAGRGGLFIDTFTHSEVANGLFLLALWAALSGRFALSLSTIGAVFFVNAFFGVWAGFVLAFVVGREVVGGRLDLRRLGRAVAVGLVVGGLFAWPVVGNIVGNPDFGRPIDFDFVDFLEYSYPNHVLFLALRWHQWLGLAMVLAVAVLALRRLDDPDRRTATALAACVLVYAIGIAAPWVTHAPLALNLHLLRSGTMIHLLAALLLTTLTVRWWFDADRPHAVLAAAMTVVGCLPTGGAMRHVAVALLLLAVVVEARFGARPGWIAFVDRFAPSVDRLRLRTAALAMLTVTISVAWTQMRLAAAEAWSEEWGGVADWAGHTTKRGSIFLTPSVDRWDGGPLDEDQSLGATLNTAFEFRAHRSLWVDPKRGAMVLWSPSTHAVWRRRMEETRALKTWTERLAYARSRGITHTVEITPGDCPGRPIFRTKRLCVFAVE